MTNQQIEKAREAGFAAGIEAAAKVADSAANIADIQWRTRQGPGSDPNDEASHYLWCKNQSDRIAKSIRALTALQSVEPPSGFAAGGDGPYFSYGPRDDHADESDDPRICHMIDFTDHEGEHELVGEACTPEWAQRIVAALNATLPGGVTFEQVKGAILDTIVGMRITPETADDADRMQAHIFAQAVCGRIGVSPPPSAGGEVERRAREIADHMCRKHFVDLNSLQGKQRFRDYEQAALAALTPPPHAMRCGRRWKPQT